jgi:hypothetical protein
LFTERQEQGAEKETLLGPIMVKTLRNKLKQDPNLLDLPVAHIETVVCQNNCSGKQTKIHDISNNNFILFNAADFFFFFFFYFNCTKMVKV